MADPPTVTDAIRLAWHVWREPRRRVWKVWHGGVDQPTPTAIRRTRIEAERILAWAPGTAWAVDMSHPGAGLMLAQPAAEDTR